MSWLLQTTHTHKMNENNNKFNCMLFWCCSWCKANYASWTTRRADVYSGIMKLMNSSFKSNTFYLKNWRIVRVVSAFFLHWPARKLFWLTATTFQCNENYSIPTGQKLFNELNWVMKTGAIYYIHVPGLPTSVTPSSKFTDTPYSMQRRKMCEPVRGNTIYSVSSRYSSCNTMFDCTMV